MPGRLLLQTIVPDRRGSAQRRINISLLQQAALLRILRPDARKAVRLQLQFHRHDISQSWILLHRLLFLRFDPQNLLHVMPDFMRQHISLRKFAGHAESTL